MRPPGCSSTLEAQAYLFWSGKARGGEDGRVRAEMGQTQTRCRDRFDSAVARGKTPRAEDFDALAVLGLIAPPTEDAEVTAAFRRTAAAVHPDAEGGSELAFAIVKACFRRALADARRRREALARAAAATSERDRVNAVFEATYVRPEQDDYGYDEHALGDGAAADMGLAESDLERMRKSSKDFQRVFEEKCRVVGGRSRRAQAAAEPEAFHRLSVGTRVLGTERMEDYGGAEGSVSFTDLMRANTETLMHPGETFSDTGALDIKSVMREREASLKAPPGEGEQSAVLREREERRRRADIAYETELARARQMEAMNEAARAALAKQQRR